MRGFGYLGSLIAGGALASAIQAPIALLRNPSGPGRKTLYTTHKGLRDKKYSGADLREIRAHGQARECARRLRRMGA